MSDNYFSLNDNLSWKEIADKLQAEKKQNPASEELTTLSDLFSKNDPPSLNQSFPLQEWLKEEHGQLAIDIYETAADLIIEAPIAGVSSDDLDIELHGDVLTITGKRHRSNQITHDQLLYQECHWGKFSRSIVLPIEVIADRIVADLKEGILTITLPKAQKSNAIKINVN